MNFIIEHYRAENEELRRRVAHLEQVLGRTQYSRNPEPSEPPSLNLGGAVRLIVGGVVNVTRDSTWGHTRVELKAKHGDGTMQYAIAFAPDVLAQARDVVPYMDHVLRQAFEEIAVAHSKREEKAG